MKQPKAQSLNLAAWVSVTIVLTVALVGTSILIAVTVSTSYEGEMSSSQEQIGADYFGIRPQHDSGGRPTGPTDRAEIAGIAGISRVALASDDISLPSISVTNQGEKRSTTGFSLAKTEPSFFPLRHLAVSAGRLFDAADGADQVAVIGPDLAAAKGWTVGDKVSHPALDTTYEIVGVLNRTDASLSGFEAFGKFNELALIPLEAPLRLNANYIPPEMSENLNSDRPTLWVSVDQGIALTSLTETVRDRLAELTSQSLYVLSGKPIAITYQHIKDQTSVSLWQVTAIVAAIGLVNISGLIMMHLFLDAREVGIKRAFGASAESIRLTYVLRYLWLSVLGAVLATLLSAALVPSFARALGTDVTSSASRLVLGLVLILAIGPLSSLLPSTLAARLSPVSAIRDQAGWGIGRRRFDLRQLLVAFAFGTAMGRCYLSACLAYLRWKT
jgi:ABC-type antimicrobial peptide transport system permease subunit